MNSLYGNFRTKFFTEIWGADEDFLTDWKESGLYTSGLISDTAVQTLFYLLYAKYTIAPHSLFFAMWLSILAF